MESQAPGYDHMNKEKAARQHLSPAEAQHIRINLLRVAGLAAVLGFLMEAIMILGGKATASIDSLLDKGLWPFLVCTALAVGQTVAKDRIAHAGLLALVTTPVAFSAAKIIQKTVSGMLDHTAAGASVDGSLLTEAGLRGFEYAALAVGLTWLARQEWGGALAHVGLGAVVGIVFGLVLSFFLAPTSVIGWLVKEVVFPIGCALIIFVSETLKELMPEEEAATETA